MADLLLSHSVAIASTCTKKLECFDEIGTRAKCNFEHEFLEMVFQLLEEIIIYLKKLERQIFRETTVNFFHALDGSRTDLGCALFMVVNQCNKFRCECDTAFSPVVKYFVFLYASTFY